MRLLGGLNVDGKIDNLTLPSGTEFPAATDGEMFLLTVNQNQTPGVYTYADGTWMLLSFLYVGSTFPNDSYYHLAYKTGTGEGLYLRNGQSWSPVNPDIQGSEIIAALGYTPLNKNGDVMLGSLGLPKTKGSGLLIENSYGWQDVIGDITPKTFGTSAAQSKQFIDNTWSWTHTAGTQGDLIYHMPHWYAPNSDVYIHLHWGHNGTNISGSLKIKLWVSIARRTYPASAFSTPIQTTIELTGLNISNSVQYCHRVDEIKLSTSGGSPTMLDTASMETDMLVNVHYEVDTIPSITGSAFENLPYFFTFDMHVQSTNVGTKNKDPNFWS